MRADAGLTTLEWLLVVAAVAGIAAVAVVMVQSTVNRSAESVQAHSARQAAASLSTRVLTERWRQAIPNSSSEADEMNEHYSRRCLQIGILYPDVDLGPEAFPGVFVDPGPGWGPYGAHKPVCSLAIRRN